MRRLLCILLLATLLALPLAARTYAVVVGIDNYAEINGLRLAEADARAVAQLLQSGGADVTLITGANASHTAVVNELRRVLGQAGPQDHAVFFFSGHGYEGGFCCYDMAGSAAAKGSTGATLAEKTRANTTNRYCGGLSYAEVLVLMRNCRAATRTVIADACYAGGLRLGLRTNAAVQAARRGPVAFMLSSSPGETSLEAAGMGHGLFTHHLLQAWTTPGLSVKDLFDSVYCGVVTDAARMGASQHPVLWCRLKN
ncbi:MAG: caspase family protein [Bacteroidales bacterium]|nr:caspase family protein [Bacteroidales bacterium]